MSKELQDYLRKDEVAPSLTSKDVCKIIETAHNFGVSTLSFGDLKLEFHKVEPKSELAALQPEPSNTPLAKQTPEKQKEDEERMLLEANVLAREAELEQLLISDPEKYEELVAQGELEDGPGSTEQNPLD
jgi:hypothetical protein